MNLVLASASFWRKELLSWLELPFKVVVSDFDESKVECEDVEELVVTLAVEKAKRVAERLGEGVVIGADTVILLDKGKIIGKPEDIDEAREILEELRGKTHEVFTGVAIVDVVTGDKIVEFDRTKVTLKDFSNEELEEYLDTGESLGKAGAYQILGEANKLVEGFEGSVTGVIGLPMVKMVNMLEEMGVIVAVDVGEVVMAKTGFKD